MSLITLVSFECALLRSYGQYSACVSRLVGTGNIAPSTLLTINAPSGSVKMLKSQSEVAPDVMHADYYLPAALSICDDAERRYKT